MPDNSLQEMALLSQMMGQSNPLRDVAALAQLAAQQEEVERRNAQLGLNSRQLDANINQMGFNQDLALEELALAQLAMEEEMKDRAFQEQLSLDELALRTRGADLAEELGRGRLAVDQGGLAIDQDQLALQALLLPARGSLYEQQAMKERMVAELMARRLGGGQPQQMNPAELDFLLQQSQQR